jgi:hypothetical protein
MLTKDNVQLADLEHYTMYMQFLKENNCDSLFDTEMNNYITMVTQVYEALGRTPEAFETIRQFPFLPDQFYTKEVKRLEMVLQGSFLQLTAEMNIKKIQEFKKQYPGLFKTEIKNLEERCRVKDRLSLLRDDNITLEKIEKYLSHYSRDKYLIKNIKEKYKSLIVSEYQINKLANKFLEYKTLFPEPDELYQKIEHMLLKRALDRNYLACTYYIQLFPDGRQIEHVKEWRRGMEYASFD